MLVVGLLAVAAAGAAVLAWPTVGINASRSGLVDISLPGFSGRVENVSLTAADGKPVPVSMRHTAVWPRVRLAAGERVSLKVEIRRPSWIGWLVGRRVVRTLAVVTPVAQLRSTLLRPKRGSVLTVHFAQPVSRLAVGHRRVTGLGSGRTDVPLGVVPSPRASAGTLVVSAAARRWERLSQIGRASCRERV